MPRTLSIFAGEKKVNVLDDYELENIGWHPVSFIIPATAIDGINITLELHVSGDSGMGVMYLRQIRIKSLF